MSDHRLKIQRLRTYSQHNLNFSDARSHTIRVTCEDWFRIKCNTHLPSEDEHWQKLLGSIVVDATRYFKSLELILRAIEGYEGREDILEQWRVRIVRFQAPHKFDKIVEEVVQDWGRANFNVVKFRSRYYDRWRKIFENRDDDCDFETEARKLVEQALLSEEQDLMPIDGRDVMQSFDIQPGSRVKEILQMARDIYVAQRCAKNELLELVRLKIQDLRAAEE